MDNIPNKTDGVDTLSDSEFNSHKNELQDLVTESGQTLNIATTDQLRAGVSVYARAMMCNDSGAANAYVLSRATSLVDVKAYYDGMTIMFETANANTGASTANFNSLGVKSIVIDNIAITAGDIDTDFLNVLVYNLANDNFELYNLATKKYVDSSTSGGVSGTRQTVQFSSVDSNGQPNYITAGAGLSVDIAATLVSVTISSSNGAVENDRAGTISADTSISGLTDSATNFLYADIAANGSVTLGSTTLAPIYQFGGTYSSTSGQATFNISEMIMKVGNGASADQTYRVFIGEAITSGGVVTAVVNYALNGQYESSFTATFPTGYFLISKNSNLGIYPRDTYCVLENTTSDLGYSIGDQVILSSPSGSSSDNNPTLTSTRNTLSMITYNGGSPILILNKSTGSPTPITGTSWKYKLIAKRGW